KKKRDVETIKEKKCVLNMNTIKGKKNRYKNCEKQEEHLAHDHNQKCKKKNIEIIEKQETHIENNCKSELSESDKKL
ncbi:15150_t:CDS:1, partial [Racocetra persica]